MQSCAFCGDSAVNSAPLFTGWEKVDDLAPGRASIVIEEMAGHEAMANFMPAKDEQQGPDGLAGNLVAIEGAVLIALGAVAIALPGLAAIAIAILLGWLFLFSGIVGLALTLGSRHIPGRQWSLISAVAALGVGLILIIRPIRDDVALMAVLGLFFIVDGIFSLMYAIEHRNQMSRRWAWMATSGIVTVLLGIYILVDAPTDIALLGMLVGGDMAFAGFSLVVIAFEMRHDG